MSNIKDIDNYRKNEVQINVIKKVLIEHCCVNESVIDTLVQAVKENTIIEYNNKKIGGL